MASGVGNIGALMSMMTYGVPANAGIEPPEGALEFFRAMIGRGVDITDHPAGLPDRPRRVVEPVDEARRPGGDRELVEDLAGDHDGVVGPHVRLHRLRLRAAGGGVRAGAATPPDQAAALRVATAHSIVAGEEVDVDLAAERLNYRLRRHHLALVLWPTSRKTEAQGSEGLTRAVFALADELGIEAPLVVPAARGCLWAWLGAAEARRLARSITTMTPPAGVAIAAGSLGLRARRVPGKPPAGHRGPPGQPPGPAAQTGHRPLHAHLARWPRCAPTSPPRSGSWRPNSVS